jgi:hypothetical protein
MALSKKAIQSALLSVVSYIIIFGIYPFFLIGMFAYVYFERYWVYVCLFVAAVSLLVVLCWFFNRGF